MRMRVRPVLRRFSVAVSLVSIVAMGCDETGRRSITPGTPGGDNNGIKADTGPTAANLDAGSFSTDVTVQPPPPPPGTDASTFPPPPPPPPGTDAGTTPPPPPPVGDAGTQPPPPPPPGTDAGTQPPPPPPSSVPVGNACTGTQQCNGGGCLQGTQPWWNEAFVGGYCTVDQCSMANPCPTGAACVYTDQAQQNTTCVATCTQQSQCRQGYVCIQQGFCLPGTAGGGGTSPIGGACTADSDCADPGA